MSPRCWKISFSLVFLVLIVLVPKGSYQASSATTLLPQQQQQLISTTHLIHATTSQHSKGDIASWRWLPPTKITIMNILSRSLRQIESQEGQCEAFVKGLEGQQEFYSPGWPEQYPKQTDCVLILEAPAGHLLRLDFRDFFDIEESKDCQFDFLEVRDGAHGYCQLAGTFCGKNFPDIITSTDRYLWLRFKSDDNIEGKGFKAVYEFIPRPTKSFTPEVETCEMKMSGDEGMFSSDDIPEERMKMVEQYNIAVDCMWVITVKEGWKIQLSFPEFKLDKPNDCDSNFIDVFSDRTDLPSRQKNFCGSIADSVTSKNNIMFVRFLAEARAVKSKFRAIFTAFRERKSEPCTDDEFDCQDATCISNELRCNGVINCRFRWDEDECVDTKKRIWDSEHIVIIMVILSLIVSGMCFTFVFKCIMKLMKDHQTIQENIRQSREQQLNEIGSKADMAAIVSNVKKQISQSNSSLQSSGSHRFDGTTQLDASCYVPGEVLPIVIQNHRSSGITSTHGSEFGDVQPEMCDSACQTRESLFSQHHETSLSTVPPSPPAPFSTFGYKKHDNREKDRYRAEAKIQVESIEKKHQMANQRPYSVQTTKSAPDVIVTH